MKLDICGGFATKSGFINVDMDNRADVVANITDSLPFKDNSIEEIWSCHTLEHFEENPVLGKWQATAIVNEFHRILKPGGKLTIAVPNFEAVVYAYLYNAIPTYKVRQYLYGSFSDEYDQHKTCYDKEMLGKMLKKAGFRNIKQTPYTFHMHIKDLTLQIEAKK